MAPQRIRKRKSAATTASTPPASKIMISTKPQSPAKTPTMSPSKRKVALTHTQKQALIDNLQLEITERARKLRAQYSLQAQGLRTRLEIRVHRIPSALRKMTIRELLEKHTQQAMVHGGQDLKRHPELKMASKTPIAVNLEKSLPQQPQPQSKPSGRGAKRKSDEMDAEKENRSHEELADNHRKRTRTEPQAKPAADPVRNAPRRMVPSSQVLSPRSHNSRTLPRSPFKSGLPSPVKSYTVRPISPLKPSITAPTTTSLAKTADKPVSSKTKSTNTATLRAASRQGMTASGAGTGTGTTRGKRTAAAAAAAASMPPPPPPKGSQELEIFDEGRASTSSDANSVGTTIVKTKKTAPRTAAAKKTAAATAKVTGTTTASRTRKTPASKAEAAAGTVRGTRTLRTRT